MLVRRDRTLGEVASCLVGDLEVGALVVLAQSVGDLPDSFPDQQSLFGLDRPAPPVAAGGEVFAGFAQFLGEDDLFPLAFQEGGAERAGGLRGLVPQSAQRCRVHDGGLFAEYLGDDPEGEPVDIEDLDAVCHS